MTKEEALEKVEKGFIAINDRSGYYMITHSVLKAGDVEYQECVKAALLLNDLKMGESYGK